MKHPTPIIYNGTAGRPWFDVTAYGAVGDGTTDDTTAIQAAITAATAAGGGDVFFPSKTFKITTRLDVADNAKVWLRGTGLGSIIKKGANIDMISLGGQCGMSDLWLDGARTTGNTGRGVIITTGANDNVSWRRIVNCTMQDVESYCIEFTANIAGFQSTVSHCFLRTWNDAQYAIKLPTGPETNGNRDFIEIRTSGSKLIDLGGSNNTSLISCEGQNPLFSANLNKLRMVGCRIQDTGALTFDGTHSSITGNIIESTAVTFAATLVDTIIQGNSWAVGAAFTDNAPGVSAENKIDYRSAQTTPGWTGGSPSLGNGTLNLSAERHGDYIKANLLFQPGSTTTFGAGAWTFSGLPIAPVRSGVALGRILDASASTYFIVAVILLAGSTTFQVLQHNSATLVGSAAPMAWANGDFMHIDFDYKI